MSTDNKPHLDLIDQEHQELKEPLLGGTQEREQHTAKASGAGTRTNGQSFTGQKEGQSMNVSISKKQKNWISLGQTAEIEFIDQPSLTYKKQSIIGDPDVQQIQLGENSQLLQSHLSGYNPYTGKGNHSTSRIAIIDKRSIHDPNHASRITIIELNEPIPPPQTCCELLKGILIMKFAVLNLTISGILIKVHYDYNPKVTIYDMVFVRAFAQLLISYLIALKDRVSLTDIPDDQWKLVIIRSITGTMTFFLFNTAVKLISLSKLAFLNNTSPLFATIIAFLFLGESMSKHELISLSICIIGVAILVQPYGDSAQEQAENTLGSLLVLISAFLNAVNFCLLRMMKGIHYAISPFYYGILGTFTSLTFILHSEAQNFSSPSRLGFYDYVLFGAVGLTSASGAMAKSLAFHYEKVSTLSLLKYTNLFYSLAADVLYFNSHIYFGEIFGAALIICSSFVIAFLKLNQII
ncbi:membrane protein transporter [Stylonychia lemnae]|uniref:Membrane protein transporter n=1 Tax=Stylonychia lemnae TaxID=5949 RepID=A0A077ZWM8_STYLE|nr:membrane protein transporter [Stylonychia lemnae]|eukprot:CDW73996.1 membrane protein transporter [Stylonychia lemnae]